MRRALELAALARGRTSPNPPVGAVLVRDGQVVGEGFTQPPGQAHAEIVALSQAGAMARGATLFVTLEPCCHHGRTGPCTEAIVEAGVAQVVFATLDPNPLVAGKGIARLAAAGITVNGGALKHEARELVRGFAHFVTLGRPRVIAKWAMTLDGRTATASGDSRWISSEASRRLVHELRDSVDAIAVGIGTAIADDPQLTVRVPLPTGRPPRQPLRVVVDSSLALPPAARMLNEPGRTLIATLDSAVGSMPERVDALQDRGAEVVGFAAANGRVDLAALLGELGQRGCLDVLVEGGAGLLGSLFDAGLVDDVMAFVAPKLSGGAAAPGPIGGRGIDRMSDALRLSNVSVRTYGDDVLLTGHLGDVVWPELSPVAEPTRAAS